MTPIASILAPFIPGWRELRPFATELWLIVTIVAVLLTPFFVRKPNSAVGVVSLVGLLAALLSLVVLRPSHADPTHRFAPMLVADGVAFFWKVLLLLFTIGVTLMWFTVTARDMHQGDGPEFFVLLLGATLGLALMGSASNLLMIFLAVEMASLPSYVLAGFRKTHRVGAEASLKYVLFGASASAVMVYGLSLLYGIGGTLQLYSINGTPGLAEVAAGGGSMSPLLAVAVVGILAGLGFKIAAVPFHFWCPDVFEGAGIDITAFLSVASKGAGLMLLLRVMSAFAEAQSGALTPLTTSMAVAVGALGIITCTVGNTAAYGQSNIKRLLAYSSIAHAGYMLCALSLLVRQTDARPLEAAAQAILLYLAVYLFMNLGAFTVAGVVTRGAGSEDLAAFNGLGRRSPLLAACMAVFMVSLIGLPPLAGFTAKVNLLWVLARNGGWWWAVVAGIGLNTLLSFYYYGRVLRAMYLVETDEPAWSGPPLATGISVTCAAALIVMFLAWGPLDRLTTAYGRLQRPASNVDPGAPIATNRTELPATQAVGVAGAR